MKVGLNVMGPEQASQEEPYSFKKYRKAEYVQRRVCFVNVQSSLLENVVFFVRACMGNAT